MRVFVTGASTGLGALAARDLQGGGHKVVVHVRRPSQAPPGGTTWLGIVTGDLADLDQTRAVAERADAYGRFDAVIHNAGVLAPSSAFAVNVVAPYVLTALMTKPARLVYVSSAVHQHGSRDLLRIDRGQVTYEDSKLYVTALAMACASRWPGTVSHAVDPGWVPTRMGGADAPDDLTAGYETQVWLATHDVAPRSGSYWYHRAAERSHPATHDPRFQRALLRVLQDRTGIRLDDRAV
ncbi:SDR family NAD(P)-dependent oxidoreductase [Cellulosimicrobium cellulans]|uniref:SDR family NAD(P)-dependent oxidoreductase n=1 Tax=Cellulosimicrobium cellulans TaxID=1710 RepID=UPI0036F0A638